MTAQHKPDETTAESQDRSRVEAAGQRLSRVLDRLDAAQ